MNKTQMELIYEALRLIQRRSVDPKRNLAQRIAYQSAYDMLRYAIDEYAEGLAQYDDVRLSCNECRLCYSGEMADNERCNACCDHEFFEFVGTEKI